jgi:hypothetical protein
MKKEIAALGRFSRLSLLNSGPQRWPQHFTVQFTLCLNKHSVVITVIGLINVNLHIL